MPNSDRNTRSRRKPGATARSRQFRSAGNVAEALLWLELKDRRLKGYKFVRQFPVGPYFPDFLNRKERLIVELDGNQHAGRASDEIRDGHLRRAGYSIVRFWSVDVQRDRPAVLETILAALEGRLDATRAPDLRFLPALTTA